ncbi:two component transcriptional regulator, LuxR family [Poseidonocella pacifica]|uniref:Two component transcriptional regulator, LuxR family n=1 Tax=Poseidonocella pacifica TaxID=871651 RepID=A0A1I0YFP7_9RHOB|nr:response regulator transcription factor [Poseidonocella pacifica]SFB11330.1 two component transcriptional regulator, LuxR family [Poseidonocella pacifica]
MTTALVIDDHPVTHIGCEQLLHDAGFATVLGARTAAEGQGMAEKHRPDLIILDLGLPDASGLTLIEPLRRGVSDARILVFSMNDQLPFVQNCLKAGAHGFVSKNDPPASLRAAVTALMAGRPYLPPELATALALRNAGGAADPLSTLTEREYQVVRLLGEGRDLQGIADALRVSYKTVANASSSAKRKLDLRNTADLIRYAISEGLC